MERRICASSADSGSSSSSTRGRTASARAIATRCCCPPDKFARVALRNFCMPTMRSASSTRSSISFLAAPRALAGRRRRCPRPACGERAHSSARPSPGRARRAAGRSRRRRRCGCAREAGRTKPATARSAVVLPEPEGPIIARISPAATSRVSGFKHDGAAIGDGDGVEARRSNRRQRLRRDPRARRLGDENGAGHVSFRSLASSGRRRRAGP